MLRSFGIFEERLSVGGRAKAVQGNENDPDAHYQLAGSIRTFSFIVYRARLGRSVSHVSSSAIWLWHLAIWQSS